MGRRDTIKGEFPRLLLLSRDKGARLSESLVLENGLWVWKLSWRKTLFVWERELEDQLYAELNCVQLFPRKQDQWKWNYNSKGVFSSSNAYEAVSSSQSSGQTEFFKSFWSKIPPLKVTAFAWKLV